jgi:hypothetical protein
MIDQQTINQIFETADIVVVVSDFVTLKKSGTNYKGLSPFSNEKTPSFMVSPAKGIFKDFSSGKGGNVVGFLMEHEKLSYPEALKYLAGKYNIAFEDKELSAEEIQQKNERESLMAVTAFAEKYFSRQLETEEGKAIGVEIEVGKPVVPTQFLDVEFVAAAVVVSAVAIWDIFNILSKRFCVNDSYFRHCLHWTCTRRFLISNQLQCHHLL